MCGMFFHPYLEDNSCISLMGFLWEANLGRQCISIWGWWWTQKPRSSHEDDCLLPVRRLTWKPPFLSWGTAGFTIPTPPTAPSQAFLRVRREVHGLLREHSYFVTSLHSPQPKQGSTLLHEPWRTVQDGTWSSLNLYDLMLQESRSSLRVEWTPQCCADLRRPSQEGVCHWSCESLRVRLPEEGAEERGISLGSSKEPPECPPHNGPSIGILSLRRARKVISVSQRGNHNE